MFEIRAPARRHCLRTY